MDATPRSVQIDNKVPDFGDARIRYERINNDQLMYVDELPVYAISIGNGEPLSKQALYQAYLQSLVEITEQTKLIRQELRAMRDYPDAIRRAEHQLEMLLKPGGSGGAFCIQEELATCWTSLKADPSVTDAEAKMAELGNWFAIQFKEAIAQEIAANPIKTADDSFAEEE